MTEMHVDDHIGGHVGGELLPHQAEALRPHVLGRHVHDLGAGRGLLGARLLMLGARHVTLVDQLYPRTFTADRLTMVGSYVHEYKPSEPMEVAFVSWPPYLFAPRNWWLSFADPKRPSGKQFLGACIMPGKDDGPEGMKHALEGAHLFGCNPGGEVQGMVLSEAVAAKVTPRWVGVLLTREDCDEFERSHKPS